MKLGRRKLGRIFRSRKIAVWLLVGVAAWSFVATLVPQASVDPDGLALWAQQHAALHQVTSALGLHRAFSTPLFLLAMSYLGIATMLCAWERTGSAAKAFRMSGKVSRSEVERLKSRPQASLQTRAGLSRSDVADRVAHALRSMRLHVTAGEAIVEGRAGRWGLFGSPVFHWALVLLILVVAAGRLTRSEGFIGVPVGDSMSDIAESYRVLDEGPLFLGHTGMDIAVTSMDREFMDGDVNRGAAPYVVLRSDGVDIVSQRVYPNSPLKYGQTTIHISDYGLSPTIALETSAGVVIGENRPLVDFPDQDGPNSTSAGLDLTNAADEAVFAVVVSVPFDTDEDSLDVIVNDLSTEQVVDEGRLLVGEALDLPDGERLRFVDTGLYARLSVVHDWSVPFIYALLVIGLIGLSVAVLSPYRRVLVMIVEADDGVSIHALIRDKNRSAIFEDRVRESLESAVGGLVPMPEEDR